jgi:hypothetical protein
LWQGAKSRRRRRMKGTFRRVVCALFLFPGGYKWMGISKGNGIRVGEVDDLL